MGLTLVTGASGTIGSLLVKELSIRGTAVRACVRTPSKQERIAGPHVEVCSIDLGRHNELEPVFDGVDQVFLLTAVTQDQVEIAGRVVDAAKKADVERIVRLSGLGAEKKAVTFGRLHRQVEEYIEASGVPYIFLRPNSFMQNFVNFSGRSIKTEGKIYMPLGLAEVSYIDARDVAFVAADLLTGDGYADCALDLTGPDVISVSQVAEAFSRSVGRKIDYVDTGEVAMRKSMQDSGMDAWVIDGVMELYAAYKDGYASVVTEGVKEITGEDPFSFDEFAADYAQYLR